MASFRATLEEAEAADVVVHVVDVSHPAWEQQMAVVGEALESVGPGDRGTGGRIIVALNKADRLAVEEQERVHRLAVEHGWEAVLVSALSRQGLGSLLATLTMGRDLRHASEPQVST